MIDVEVARLRRLRVSALKLRAVARALARDKFVEDAPLFERGACAAWRVARTVSGRLRAHPHFNYQKDAGLGTLVKNGLVALAVSLRASNRAGAQFAFGCHIRSVLRELDDARAFTWAAELSDTFGRSQQELRRLLGAVQGLPLAHIRTAVTPRPAERRTVIAQRVTTPVVASDGARRDGVTVGDWPFLAI